MRVSLVLDPDLRRDDDFRRDRDFLNTTEDFGLSWDDDIALSPFADSADLSDSEADFHLRLRFRPFRLFELGGFVDQVAQLVEEVERLDGGDVAGRAGLGYYRCFLADGTRELSRLRKCKQAIYLN
jgi:hypothetical protein